MANASDTQPVPTPAPEMPATIAPFVDSEQWAEMDEDHQDEIACYVSSMECAADCGDPIAESWIADSAEVRDYLSRVLDT